MMNTARASTFMKDPDYMNEVKRALELKRTTQELNRTKEHNKGLLSRIDAVDKAAKRNSLRHASEMTIVENQRDEFCKLLDVKGKELAIVEERANELESKLQVASEKVARYEKEAAASIANEFHVHIRPENAYDKLLEHAVRNLGEVRPYLVEQYQDVVTHTSNMTWQTLLNETMSDISDLFFVLNIPCKRMNHREMVVSLEKNEELCGIFVRYIQRCLEYDKFITRKPTKAQMLPFRNRKLQSFNSLAEGFRNILK